MKKILMAITLLFSSFAFANVNAVVSIVPQKTFVKAIGKDKVDVSVMVKPGNSPHTYEPKPSQMRNLSKADIYFSIGVEFEEAWLPKFANQNKKMKIVNMSKDIKRIPMVAHHHHEDEHEHHADHDKDEHEHHADHDEHKHHHHHHHGNLDPHVWISPDNVKVLAKTTLKYLIKIDRKNKNYYEKNYKEFIKHINETDKKIKEIFKNLPKDSKFMVYHPSWGYFAKQYDLVQVPVEIEGKAPKPKEVQELIKHAKEEKIKAIFINPEFSDQLARQIANELHISVISVSPLSENWSQNLIKFSKAIAKKQ